MGKAGREKVRQQYSHDAYYNNLMAVYRKAIQQCGAGAAITPLVQIGNVAGPTNKADAL
jgi:hypothetical protein